MMSTRADRWEKLNSAAAFDLLVIGGGATGLGVAVDAAQRGLRVALVERTDYAKGTSSRATKLLHGGVRYLAQGNVSLVREALHERAAVLRNAPALAKRLEFVMPGYRWWESPFYGVGLKMYDQLAGSAGLGPTRFLSRSQTQRMLPNVQTQGLCSGVAYWDAQFDDARLALALALTASQQGAVVHNHCEVTELVHAKGKVCGAHLHDRVSGQRLSVRANCVVNATGVWVDPLRMADAQALQRPAQAMVAPSQGVHLVVDKRFWPSDAALLVPKTADGRVLFAVPWLGSVILGTTDTPRQQIEDEPKALAHEVEFILREAARYLAQAPSRSDVRSVWVGLRPLVKPLGEEGSTTQSLSREHTILVSQSGLVTVTGGKWTTYRAMAEDVLARAAEAKLVKPGESNTANLALAASAGVSPAALTPADVVRMVAEEHAHTVEDVLARRCRALFLDAQLALTLVPMVAEALVSAHGQDPRREAFEALANQYSTLPS